MSNSALQAMENPDFLIKNKLEQIVENFKVSSSLLEDRWNLEWFREKICLLPGRSAAGECSFTVPTFETSMISMKRRCTCMKSLPASLILDTASSLPFLSIQLLQRFTLNKCHIYTKHGLQPTIVLHNNFFLECTKLYEIIVICFDIKSVQICVDCIKGSDFFQWQFSILRNHILFQSLSNSHLQCNPVWSGCRGENIPKTLSLQILPKTITSPHFPLSKAPDLDITNSNSGTLLFVNTPIFSISIFYIDLFVMKAPSIQWASYVQVGQNTEEIQF